MKDAHRYIVTGDIRACVIIPQKRSSFETDALEREICVSVPYLIFIWHEYAPHIDTCSSFITLFRSLFLAEFYCWIKTVEISQF